jgi:hypothetical protein
VKLGTTFGTMIIHTRPHLVIVSFGSSKERER